MSKAEITKPGLWSIAFLVAVLWACIAAQRLTIRYANLKARHALDELHALRAKPAVRTRSSSIGPRLARRDRMV